MAAGDGAGRFSVGALFKTRALRKIRFARNVEGFEAGRRHQNPSVSKLNIYGIVWGGCDQLRLRGHSFFPELLYIPAAGDNQPCSRFHRSSGLPDFAQRIIERRRPNPIHFRTETQSSADTVQVGVDQSGNHRSSLKIDDTRPRSCKFPHIRGFTDG